MLAVLHTLDYAVLIAYLVAMLAMGVWLSGKQDTDEEYFLGGRQMPWFAVGLSVIASLLSSLTYLSEPGEVWNSGVTQFFGKMLAIPLEMLFVIVFIVPFMMRFRFTSAYEYLEYRFSRSVRTLGVVLFTAMAVLWMGFVVFLSSRALAEVMHIDLLVVILTVGVVSTIYTYMGGLKAVVWTDVVQVLFLLGGGLFAIGYVAWTTETWLPQWYDAASQWLERAPAANLAAGQSRPAPAAFFDSSPFVRSTIVTVAISMCVWHICTHAGNQMTLQRYFSTKDIKAARRSFITGSVAGVILNLMLMVVGLALLYFYFSQSTVSAGGVLDIPLDGNLDELKRRDRDLIFATFATERLPAGLGGAIMAALLAAAMSSIDSGVNSIATVISVEIKRHQQTEDAAGHTHKAAQSHVKEARWLTLACGMFITVAAYGLSFLPAKWGAVDAMPRTFNAITPAMGGLFLVGVFMPRVGAKPMMAGIFLSLVTSISLGYYTEIGHWLQSQSWLPGVGYADPNIALVGGTATGTARALTQVPGISFAWIMPCSLLVLMVSAWLLSFVIPNRQNMAGLTWQTRKQPCRLVQFEE